MAVSIRCARPGDLVALGELAIRSKAHWGYDEAFMAACRDELLVPDEALAVEIIHLCETDGMLAGFYRLERPGRRTGAAMNAEIEGFFVDPHAIGSGAGRVLWRDLLQQARLNGAGKIICQSDPNAAGFYERMGMRRVGSRPSASIPGRELPLLELPIGPEVA